MMSPDENPTPVQSPFQIICPVCGRDSDAEDAEFLVVAATVLQESEFFLMEVVCRSCDTHLDVAVWPVDGPALEAAAGGSVEAMEPGGVALLDRYLRAVAGYGQEWERLYAEEHEGSFGQYGIDLSQSRVSPSSTRYTAVDARVLSAARACRAVAVRCPGRDPVGMLFAGPFKCALSLDEIPNSSQSTSLHLSVSNSLGLGPLRRIEEALLTGLYFTPDERPFLHEEPGSLWPCTHIRYTMTGRP